MTPVLIQRAMQQDEWAPMRLCTALDGPRGEVRCTIDFLAIAPHMLVSQPVNDGLARARPFAVPVCGVRSVVLRTRL